MTRNNWNYSIFENILQGPPISPIFLNYKAKNQFYFNKHLGGFCEVRASVMFLSIPLFFFFNFIGMKQQKLLMERDPQ